MESQTIEKVWYRSRPLTVRDVSLKAMEDSGSLVVAPRRLQFRGKKGTVEITDIHGVSAKRSGRDFVNKWVTVEYGDGQIAMFVISGKLGWSGILGGNQRLLEALQSAASAGGEA